MNDAMSEEDVFVGGHIEIFADENFLDNDGDVSQRGKKRQKLQNIIPRHQVKGLREINLNGSVMLFSGAENGPEFR
jgi:hypothetical protein